MTSCSRRPRRSSSLIAIALALVMASECLGHGTVVFPMSRVYRVYQSNPSNPGFTLAASAVQIDGALSYYTWNEVSRNIPQAVNGGLQPGFDYSPWMPDGQLASAGRVDPLSSVYPRTYAGLDQVSPDWPKTLVIAGSTISVQFLATAAHSPSVWDVWMTRPTWNPSMPLTWSQMEFLGRPNVSLANPHYTFDLVIPGNRSGHHVLWIAWQRNDPAGEVFVSTSDIDVASAFSFSMTTTGNGTGDLDLRVLNLPAGASEGFTLFSFDTAGPLGQGSVFGIRPDLLTLQGLTSPAAPGNPFHFIAPYTPGLYPTVPFSVPPGVLAALGGLTLDGQVVLLDAAYGLSGATGVSRVTL